MHRCAACGIKFQAENGHGTYSNNLHPDYSCEYDLLCNTCYNWAIKWCNDIYNIMPYFGTL